jgi:dihydrodipicolinate synthase/N-acetylneuraminate lyase
MLTRTVVGIPASFGVDGDLETNSTENYLKYLEDKGVYTVMTTEGTSTFNLLNENEIHKLNECVVSNFSGFKIIGVPNLSLRGVLDFVKKAEDYLDDKSNLMFLYPERFYSEKIIIDFFKEIRKQTSSNIYIHGKTIRNGTGGTWDYNSSVINELFEQNILKGIKEEHPNLLKSYDFVNQLRNEIDVIVAGGSMRRYEYLRSAGANSFLSGAGNLFPEIEQAYIDGYKDEALDAEKRLFAVFMKNGWHKSLRNGLKYLNLTCYNDRKPWPETSKEEMEEIGNVIEEIKT